jgi:parallel beta-helix repeat protein
LNYNFRGSYDPAKSYKKLDVVVYKRSTNESTRSFCCITDHNSDNPQEPNPNRDTTYWGVLNANSNFPNSIDDFITHTNIQASDRPLVQRYTDLTLKTNRTPAEDDELNQLTNTLRDKIILPDDWNKLQSALANMQMFIKNNVEGYIVQKQEDFTNFVDLKKGELDAEIDQFDDVGTYSPEIAYYQKNMVEFNGNVYIAKRDSLNKTPIGDNTDPYWRLLSRKGDKGDAGVAVTLKGDYNNSTTYQVGDGVVYANQIFYAKKVTTGNLPTDPEYWVLADKVYVNVSPPPSPIANQIWLDIGIPNMPKFKYWNGSKWIESSTSRSVTVVVAANNSSEKSKAGADFIVPDDADNAQDTINAAINSLPSYGGKVVLMEGTYNINAPIVLISNVILEGMGTGTVVKHVQDAITGYAFDIVEVESVGIKNILVDGNTTLSRRQGGINIKNAAQIQVSNCIFKSNMTYGVYSEKSTDIRIDSSYFSNLYRGVGLSDTSRLTVNGSNFKNLSNNGITISNKNSENVFSNNIIDDSEGTGIYLSGTTDNQIKHNLITGNVIKNTTSHGIVIAACHDTVVSANIISNTATGNGINLGGSRNTIIGNKISNVGNMGIYIPHINNTDNIIANNHIEGSLKNGIHVLGGANTVISGNFIIGNGQINDGFVLYSGILLMGAKNFNIQNNTFRAGYGDVKQDFGIYIDFGSENNFIANNDLFEAGIISGIRDKGTNTITVPPGVETPEGAQAKADAARNASVPINGGTMTGILTAQNNTDYTTKQVRNIILSTANPASADGENGDIWIKYKA